MQGRSTSWRLRLEFVLFLSLYIIYKVLILCLRRRLRMCLGESSMSALTLRQWDDVDGPSKWQLVAKNTREQTQQQQQKKRMVERGTKNTITHKRTNEASKQTDKYDDITGDDGSTTSAAAAEFPDAAGLQWPNRRCGRLHKYT